MNIRYLSVFIGVVFLVEAGIGQQTYNKRMSLGYAATVFTGLEMRDSSLYLTGIISDTLPPFYPSGIFFAEADSVGNIIGLKPFFVEGSRLDNFHCNFTIREGGFLSTGFFVDTTGHTAIYMMDEQGEMEQLIITEELEGYSLPLARGGAVPGAGGNILFATDERSSYGLNNDDAILRLYDKEGNIQWENNYGAMHGNLKDIPREVAAHQGHFIVACWLTNSNKVDQNFITQNYLFAIDTTGAVLWEYYSPEEVLMREPEAFYVEEDGSVIVSTFLGEEFIINASRNGMEWHTNYIYKLNPPNEVEWSVSFEQPYPTIGNLSNLHKIIKATDDSGYVIAGHVTQLDEEEGPDIRGWLLKISPEGDSLWSRRFRYLEPNPQTDFHEFYDLEATPDGGYLMAGQVKWEAGPPPIQQGWLVK